MIGQPTGPAAVLADGGQSYRAALLAAEPRPGDPAVAQPGRRRVDGSSMAAVAAGHLDFQVVPRQIAERGEGRRQGHGPDVGRTTVGRNCHRIILAPDAAQSAQLQGFGNLGGACGIAKA